MLNNALSAATSIMTNKMPMFVLNAVFLDGSRWTFSLLSSKVLHAKKLKMKSKKHKHFNKLNLISSKRNRLTSN